MKKKKKVEKRVVKTLQHLHILRLVHRLMEELMKPDEENGKMTEVKRYVDVMAEKLKVGDSIYHTHSL